MADETLDQLQVYGTGALWQPESPLNYNLKHMPGVKAYLPSFNPEDTHLTQYLSYSYNQGASPSCVWHTISGVMTGNEKIERHGQEIIYNAMEMHRRTGDPNQGRYTGDMLAYSQKNGVLRAAGNQSDFIDTYAFAPKGSFEEFVNTYKAAIAAGYICGIALRLPSVFGRECQGPILGWDTYHEVIGCGYRPTPGQFGSALIKNSWSASWGDNGFGWCPFDLLLWNNYQEGACFINTIIDARDSDITPLPPNPPDPPPPPPPPVRKPVVTGYAGISGQLPYVTPGKQFIIQGTGFAGSNVTVQVGGVPLPLQGATALQLVVTAPATNAGLVQPLVTVDGVPAVGPNLVVTGVVDPTPPNPDPQPPNPPNPDPQPPTPGVLTVTVRAWRLGIYVTVSEGTTPVEAFVTATINGEPLAAMIARTGLNGSPATFPLPRTLRGKVVAIATANDGREGIGTAEV